MRRHLPGFVARLEEAGHALPEFVKKELEGFAGCGPDTTTAPPCIYCYYCAAQGVPWPCADPPPAEDAACFAGEIGCDPGPDVPVCGCDGAIYASSCAAAAAGVGVAYADNCPAEAGMMPCGAGWCASATQYCEETLDHGGYPTYRYECRSLPQACDDDLTCDCFPEDPCGDSYYIPAQICEVDPDGSRRITCVWS